MNMTNDDLRAFVDALRHEASRVAPELPGAKALLNALAESYDAVLRARMFDEMMKD
jgi:hypothetical protein